MFTFMDGHRSWGIYCHKHGGEHIVCYADVFADDIRGGGSDDCYVRGVAREICSTEGRYRSPHISSKTGLPLRVARVSGVIKRVAACVMTM
jgi:hypothetical protein